MSEHTNKIDDLISDLTNMWITWVAADQQARNHEDPFMRHEGAKRAESLQVCRRKIVQQIDEYFESLIKSE